MSSRASSLGWLKVFTWLMAIVAAAGFYFIIRMVFT